MRSDQMTSRERVFAAIKGQPIDRYPVIAPTSVANIDCMNLSHSFFPTAHTQADQMAALAATSHDILGFDTVMPYFSVQLEAVALGCSVNWGTQIVMPLIERKALQQLDELKVPKNILGLHEFKQVLKAIKLLKKKYGNEVAIIGKVIGPWSLAYNLYGVENLVLDTILAPDAVHAAMRQLVEIPIQFAAAQFEAGADLVTWAEHVSADLFSPAIYAEFMLPIHKLATGRLRGYGDSILHVCGYVMDRLDLFRQTGFCMFHIDSRNDIRNAVEIAGQEIVLTGAINNPTCLLGSETEEVAKEVAYNLDCGIRLIAPECAIPYQVSNENLLALTRAVHMATPYRKISN